MTKISERVHVNWGLGEKNVSNVLKHFTDSIARNAQMTVLIKSAIKTMDFVKNVLPQILQEITAKVV